MIQYPLLKLIFALVSIYQQTYICAEYYEYAVVLEGLLCGNSVIAM